MSIDLRAGDCRDTMRALDADSVHAIVTDPPYGLSFMGREWDHGVPGVEFWTEALRVVKPGAHLVAFGGSRTYHRIACAIEDAGWEIRDCLQWLYGSGFPKSHDVSKAIDKSSGIWRGRAGAVASGNGSMGGSNYERTEKGGPVTAAAAAAGFGTALKPAYEPIVLARKPFRGTVAACFCDHGTGALNIDECRIPHANEEDKAAAAAAAQRLCRDQNEGRLAYGRFENGEVSVDPYLASMQSGRWPANIILGCACERDHEPGCACAVLDAQSGELSPANNVRESTGWAGGSRSDRVKSTFQPSTGGASRFFYTAKATRTEREAGLEHRQRRRVSDGRSAVNDTAYQRDATLRGNTHPTVKPVSLMRWLVRLVGGQRGGLVLDPFMGSGTTGIACAYEGFSFIGCDLDPGHVDIARGRIVEALAQAGALSAEQLQTVPERNGPTQLGLLAEQEGLPL